MKRESPQPWAAEGRSGRAAARVEGVRVQVQGRQEREGAEERKQAQGARQEEAGAGEAMVRRGG